MTSRAKKLIPVELLRRSCRSKNVTLEKKHHPRESDSNQDGYKEKPKCEQYTMIEQTGVDVKPKLSPDGIIQAHARELDLERTLLGGQSFRWTKADDGSFTGVLGQYVIQLWRLNSTDISFKLLNTEVYDYDRVSKSLKDYFQLKYNLADLYEEWSAKDKNLKKCCQDYQGFRILRQDPVENLFSFICATNNNIKRISQMVDKMCTRFGEPLATRESYYSFPSVERLASDDVFDTLRYQLGFGYRAKFISETAKKLLLESQSKQLTPREYLLSLRDLAYKDTCKFLCQFPGIGRKVADCICLMSMDHLNSVPIDCHIYEIVCRSYMPDLREQHKTLTERVHDLIGKYFNELHGPLAGWSTSVLFIAELKHLKSDDQSRTKSARKKVPVKQYKIER